MSDKQNGEARWKKSKISFGQKRGVNWGWKKRKERAKKRGGRGSVPGQTKEVGGEQVISGKSKRGGEGKNGSKWKKEASQRGTSGRFAGPEASSDKTEKGDRLPTRQVKGEELD